MKSGTRSANQLQLICLPDPGVDSDASIVGELTAWYATSGQSVTTGQLLYQVSWPGLVIDYAAETSGVLVRKCVDLRQPVQPETLIAQLSVKS